MVAGFGRDREVVSYGRYTTWRKKKGILCQNQSDIVQLRAIPTGTEPGAKT
jgi:hypothetical protein